MSNQEQSPLSVMLTCRNPKRTVAFYRDSLGFELSESWPDADDPKWANLKLGTQSVMIGAAMNPEDVGKMCAGDPAAEKYWRRSAEEFQKNKSGVGVQIYVAVPDVDAYHKTITKKGVKLDAEPKSQFYGIRDFGLDDPDGYRLIFYTPITLSSCQSCGMPLTDAKPGQMYCQYCTDESGKLKSYDVVLEGTVSGYFMGMKKMERKDAEKAAREHLAGMPAWKAHG